MTTIVHQPSGLGPRNQRTGKGKGKRGNGKFNLNFRCVPMINENVRPAYLQPSGFSPRNQRLGNGIRKKGNGYQCLGIICLPTQNEKRKTSESSAERLQPSDREPRAESPASNMQPFHPKKQTF